MASKPLIDDKVFDQIMQVRDSGRCNMCSVKEVQYHAFHMNLYELVNLIPLAKITLLQGDPGDGKSTLMLKLIAELSKGGYLPDGTKIEEPILSMYQCSEDGVADTIIPRLESFRADCSHIAYIDEAIAENLTLDDDRIRDSIHLSNRGELHGRFLTNQTVANRNILQSNK